MALTCIKIEENFKDIKLLEKLSLEAFPPEEYLAPKTLIDMTKEDDGIQYLALYNKDNFVGYIVVKLYKRMAYLFFLAIDFACRSKGYGSMAIEMLKTKFKDYQHVVDFEMLDNNAQNTKQREHRRNFYLRNGYKATGQFLTYKNVSFEVFCMDDNFNIDIFKEMMSTLNIKDSNPIYFKINKLF